MNAGRVGNTDPVFAASRGVAQGCSDRMILYMVPRASNRSDIL